SSYQQWWRTQPATFSRLTSSSSCWARRYWCLAARWCGCLAACGCRCLRWLIRVLPVRCSKGAGRAEYYLRQTSTGHHVALDRLPGSVRPPCRLSSQALAFRVVRLARMPKRSSQVVRTTRDAREPWHGQNTIQVVVRLLRLDLGEHNHVPGGPLGEAKLATVLLVQQVRVVELRAATTAPGAPPIRREQAGVGKLLRLLPGLDVWTDHPLEPT